MGQMYNINFATGKMDPINVSDKNDLPIGTILHLKGYSDPDYVIVENFGVDPRFSSHGTTYQTINIHDFTYSRHAAHTLMWLKDKTSGMIQMYITDKVLSPEEIQEIKAKADTKQSYKEAYQAKAEAEYKRLEAIGRELFAKHIPADAQALIVAEHHIDDSDMMTDYHNHRTKETVIIGYSMHKRDLFSEMRKAAARIPETAHLGPGKGHFSPNVVIGSDFVSNGSAYHKESRSHWHHDLDENGKGYRLVFSTKEEAQAYVDSKGIPGSVSFDDQIIPFTWEIEEREIEHREKYSMGGGYYLKDGYRDSSGWCVSKKTVRYRDQWDNGLFVAMAKRCIFEEKSAIDKP